MSWLKFHREQLTVSLSFQGCLSRYAWVDCLNGQHQISLFFIDVGAISFLITPSIPFPDIFTRVVFEDKYGKEKGKTNKHTRQSNTVFHQKDRDALFRLMVLQQLTLCHAVAFATMPYLTFPDDTWMPIYDLWAVVTRKWQQSWQQPLPLLFQKEATPPNTQCAFSFSSPTFCPHCEKKKLRGDNWIEVSSIQSQK